MDFRMNTVQSAKRARVRRRLGISRRGVLQLGLGATAGLLAGSQRASAQDATPVATSVADLTAEERGWLERASRRTSTAGSISRSRARRSSAGSSTATWSPPNTPTPSASTRR